MHFGAPWPPSIARIIKDKVYDPRIQRKIGLEGHRFTAQEAMQAGFVDAIASGDTEDVIKKAQELGEAVGSNAALGVWGLIRVSAERYSYTSVLMSYFQIDSEERALHGYAQGVAQRRDASEECCDR